MANRETLERWLDLLIEHTTLGNIPWNQIDNKDVFMYVTPSSRVYIETRDNDRVAPFVLTVTRGDGEITDTWTTWGLGTVMGDADESAPDYMQARIVNLYHAVRQSLADDPIAGMLKELEDLPPF